jgi:hypothetical protein
VLDESCRFDELGLWAFRNVWFSAHGTLLSTAAALVDTAEAGYHSDELTALLHVETKAALAKLAAEGRLSRQVVDGRLLYLSADSGVRRRQLSARQVRRAEPATLGLGTGVRVLPDELKAAIVLFYSLLDERQRRLYAGLEAAKIGHGGDSQIASLLGLDPDTVARGRRELLTGADQLLVLADGGGSNAYRSRNCCNSSPTAIGSPSPSATTRPPPRSGTRSSTASLARSARTGPANP